ncbi:MAG: hypothetical protein HFE25_00700 [Clostridia bacterium]|jgi:hypothetical protein|nr:hypothetical protein [Clostridia bacterium]
MRKLAIKIACALLFALSCALLAACGDAVSLKEGAVVRLNVVTEAETFDVNTSYGRLEGAGKTYTVTVDVKKDFSISVSSHGLKTQTVPVTVADLASGSCEKSVELKEELEKEVSITVSGNVENVVVACDGVNLPLKRGAYTGLLTRTQLKKGVTVNADGAIENTVTFTDEQLEGSFLKAEAFLVKNGYKTVDVHGNMESKYLIDGEDRLIDTVPIYLPSVYGGNEFSGLRAILPADFEGKLYLREIDRIDVASFEIEKNLPAYGTLIEFEGFHPDEQYKEVILKNFSPLSGFEGNAEYVYVEIIEGDRTYLEKQWVYRSNYDNIYYYALFPKNVVAMWQIAESTATCIQYDGGISLDCNQMQVVDFDSYLCLYNNVFNEVRTDIDALYLSEYEYDGGNFTEIYRPIPAIDGVFPYSKDVQFVYVKLDDPYNPETPYYKYLYIDNDEPAHYINVGGKWCIPVPYYDEVIYRITLKDEAGNLVKGAKFADNLDDFFESSYSSIMSEVSPGIYEYGISSYTEERYFYVQYGKTTECVCIDFDPDCGIWKRTGNLMEGSITVRKPQSIGFYFDADMYDTGSSNVSYSYSYEAVDENVKLSPLALDSFRYGVYVWTSYGSTVRIKVTVKIRNNYSDEVATYEEIVTVDTRKIDGVHTYHAEVGNN